jgi:hypothetical protein
MYYHKFVNAETGKETITELSISEIAVIEENISKVKAEIKAEEKAKAEKINAKAAIAERLGLTPEELATLLS